MAKKYLKLGEILLKEGLITPEQLNKAIELQKKNPSDLLGDILVKAGMIADKDLLLILSKQLDIPCASLESGLLNPTIGQDLQKLIPEAFARQHQILPLHRHDDAITVAMSDPTDIVLLDNLRKMTGLNIQKVLATAKDIYAALNKFYGEGGMLKTAIEASYKMEEATQEKPEEQLSLDMLVATTEKTPVIQLTDLMIREAIKQRASDIHIEPFQDRGSIRFRVDGVLHEIPPPNKALFLPLVSRLKILSRMDIAEKRLPQDGTFSATIEDRPIDFRVSTIPTIYGEKMVLRILDKSVVAFNVENIGFEKEEVEIYRSTIHKPYGMILLTGPTGSGKTTTLYAALSELNNRDRNIVTIEDPVEYKIDGINQVQVKQIIGLTFANALRSFLRQDPDIMLVGETRDVETAQICMRAALTGHLVFSTLHTNDAPAAVTRLVDIGIEPYLISSSLLLVVAQRLVRRLCDKCKESYKPASLPKKFVLTSPVLFRPRGCEACGKTGYYGRLAVFEMMRINEVIAGMINDRASVNQIRAEAKKNGMTSLEENGYKKVNAGLTSLDEVLRVTMLSE